MKMKIQLTTTVISLYHAVKSWFGWNEGIALQLETVSPSMPYSILSQAPTKWIQVLNFSLHSLIKTFGQAHFNNGSLGDDSQLCIHGRLRVLLDTNEGQTKSGLQLGREEGVVNSTWVNSCSSLGLCINTNLWVCHMGLLEP